MHVRARPAAAAAAAAAAVHRRGHDSTQPRTPVAARSLLDAQQLLLPHGQHAPPSALAATATTPTAAAAAPQTVTRQSLSWCTTAQPPQHTASPARQPTLPALASVGLALLHARGQRAASRWRSIGRRTLAQPASQPASPTSRAAGIAPHSAGGWHHPSHKLQLQLLPPPDRPLLLLPARARRPDGCRRPSPAATNASAATITHKRPSPCCGRRSCQCRRRRRRAAVATSCQASHRRHHYCRR